MGKEDTAWAAKLDFNGNELTITSNSTEGGKTTKTELICESSFPSNRVVGINIKYLLDALGSLDSQFINLNVEEQDLKPLRIIEDHEDYFYAHMIMPLRI